MAASDAPTSRVQHCDGSMQGATTSATAVRGVEPTQDKWMHDWQMQAAARGRMHGLWLQKAVNGSALYIRGQSSRKAESRRQLWAAVNEVGNCENTIALEVVYL